MKNMIKRVKVFKKIQDFEVLKRIQGFKALGFFPLFALFWFVSTGIKAAPEKRDAIPGIEKGNGKVPYEISLAGRKEPAGTLCGFDDMKGWKLELYDGAKADLQSSTAEVLWNVDNPTACLAYRGTSAKSRIVFRPPAMIPIQKDLRAVEIWCFGNNWSWVPDPSTPRVEFLLLLKGDKSGEFKVNLAQVRWKEWWLIHKRFSRNKIDKQLFFSGFEISGGSNKQVRNLYFESLRFTRDERKPLEFKPRPERNIKLFKGQSPGLNTGPGRLPFPTREETILPVNMSGEFEVKAGWERPGKIFCFQYKGRSGSLSYRIKLTDSLPEIYSRWNSSPRFRILSGSKVVMPENRKSWVMSGAEQQGKILKITLQKGQGTEVEYRFRIWQKSLVWDVICRGGKASELVFGDCGPFLKGEQIAIPFMTYGSSNPPVLLLWPDKNTGLFMTTWPDWYRSNGSQPFCKPYFQPGPGTHGNLYVRNTGSMKYVPKTDGRRNDLFERVFITVSPVYEEVLPSIPNPSSPDARTAGSRLWQESWGPSDFKKEELRSSRLRAFGISRLTQCNHEIAWRDGGESFTLRLMAAPGKGGDKALKKYVEHQKSLGWLSGLYTNYTDFAPVNKNWNPDFVQLTSDGQLRTAWPRCYALKPAKAVELDRYYAPRIKAKYHSTAAYTDVHTAAAPWGYCDYDYRVPGAGTFAQTVYLYGEILLHDRSVYGPTWSEGTYQWLYAGLASGNYGLCYGGVNISEFPLLPVFDLREIHTRECDIGVPWTGGFFKTGNWMNKDKIEHSIDRFIAATLAYGHIGWLVKESYGMRLTCRSYYMILPVQTAYAHVAPGKILYNDPAGSERKVDVSMGAENSVDAVCGSMLSVSDALRGGAWRKGRLFVRYKNGLELFVNGSDSLWLIRDLRDTSNPSALPGSAINHGKGDSLTRLLPLPPAGYFAEGKDLRVFSGIINGKQRDYSVNKDFVYADSRGDAFLFPFGLECRGGVAIRKTGPSELEVIDCGGNEWIGIGGGKDPFVTEGPSPILCKGIELFSVKGFSDTGKELGDSEIRKEVGRGYFRTIKGAVRYKILLRRNGLSAEQKASGKKTAEQKAAGKKTAEQKTAEKKLTHPDFAAIPLKSEVVLSKGSISFFIENLGLDGENSIKKLLPGWIRPLPGKDKDAPVYSFKIVSSDRIPPEGKLLSVPFRIEETTPVFYDLLSPSLPFKWSICYRGKKEIAGSSETGSSCIQSVRVCGGVKKNCLFTHPPYKEGSGSTIVDFGPLILPDKSLIFSAFLGISDGGAVSDGVVFSVYASQKPDRMQLLKKQLVKRPGWKEMRFELSEYSGKTIFLRFVADPGEADNTTSDWACWGDPRIISKEKVKILKFQKKSPGAATERKKLAEKKPAGKKRKLIPIGLQLYAVRGEFAKDIEGTLAKVAKLGYKGVEFWGYGGGPFVYKGKTAVELKKILDRLGLKCCGMHLYLKTLLGDNLEKTIEINKILGNKNMIVVMAPKQMSSVESIKNYAKTLNGIAERAKKKHMRVGYHCHAPDFKMFGNRTGWDILFSNTKPDVIMQLDVGNCAGGGGDPVAILKKFPGRARTVHLKEFKGAVIEKGNPVFEELLGLCETTGKTEWYIVEMGGNGGMGFSEPKRAIDSLHKMGR